MALSQWSRRQTSLIDTFYSARSINALPLDQLLLLNDNSKTSMLSSSTLLTLSLLLWGKDLDLNVFLNQHCTPHQWKSTNINKQPPHLPTLSLQTIIQTSNLKGERIFLLFKENHPTIVPNRSYPLITSFLKDLQLLLLHNLVTVHLGGRNLIPIVPSFKFSLK